jgi:type 1 glutamine amidotransferase
MTDRKILAAVLVGVIAGALVAQDDPPRDRPTNSDDDPDFTVLVFSKTAGFRHGSIPDGIKAVEKLGSENDFAVDATEDAEKFNDENLKKYAVVVFLSTTRDVLDDTQEKAFKKYINEGGGFAGIHAASDTEYDWPWYGKLVGARFKSHPRVQPADVVVSDRIHLSTRHLPPRWRRTDEWYDYQAKPDEGVHILATLDETTYKGGTMSNDHPIAWCHEFDGGRAWYTGGGHTKESFTEEAFLEHILGGIRWASGEGGETPEPADDKDPG